MNPPQPGVRTPSVDPETTAETRALVSESGSHYAGPRLELHSINVVPVLRPAARTQDLEQRLLAREQELDVARAEVSEARDGRAALLAENQSLEQRCKALEQSLMEAVERVAEAEAAAADRSPTMRLLREELRLQQQRVTEVEADLRAAENHVHRLEALLRQPLARGLDAAAPAAPDKPLARSPSSSQSPGPVLGQTQSPGGAASLSASGLNEVPTRYLMMIEGDTETLFPLSLRTTVGREPDNDIQVDSRFISRHHAAVHVGVHHTVIEDLGSTNGIIVNGQRTRRRALGDGDIVVIGKSQFRFLERSPRPDFI
jgi:hypothetical protein